MASSSPYQSASLYVGDLHPTVTEALLFEIFKAVGPVASIRVCRDAVSRRSLGYAYVNFHNVVDAERALDTLNYTPIKGKPCRIMWSHRDPSVRKSGQGNVFIKNLDKTIDNKALYDTFSTFGNILSCKVVTDGKGNSKGYGFVHYETKEAADNAIVQVHGMLLNGKIVYVGPFIPKKERIPGSDPEKFTNVYLKNLEPSYTEEDLLRDFTKFGEIQNAVLMKDEKGNSKGFGFVNYRDHEAAKRAVTEMEGKKVGEKEIYVGRAQKRGEREAHLKKLREERAQKYQGINLYIKNLDDTINDKKLEEAFAAYGPVTSCRVMVDEKGNGRGFGFVCFTSADDASKAVTEMNGSMLAGKPIYVALAERKEVRRAKLEAQHAARAAARMTGTPNLSPSVYPGAPVFYPHQAPQQRQGFVYPQGMPVTRRWGGPTASPTGSRQGYQPMPNYMVPAAQRQQAHRPPRGGQQPQGNGRSYKFAQNVRNQQPNAAAPVQPAAAAPTAAAKAQPGEMPLNPTTLASASPEERKNILGENLFPLIEEINPKEASKITGMLLESLDVPELLHLLQSPEALHSKVDEALEVLQLHTPPAMEGAPNGESADS